MIFSVFPLMTLLLPAPKSLLPVSCSLFPVPCSLFPLKCDRVAWPTANRSFLVGKWR
ncbi:hypothetical protein BJP36_41700 [Moorena producens JHB]|uniref:Uncharacterized protein n=1 Tax=Moorena producens (strain JHB) TaxID=1454205 RepID=A0A9Q9UVJ7_MOOP1|nr:hypothetical protein [Moorena producens]WAN68881.1 hypothetical protein BJP36_41700 [Moorena producens JHB]